MKNPEILSRLAEIVHDDMQSLSQNIILEVDGKYELFGLYSVVKNSDKTCQVTKHRTDPRLFSSTRSAVAWCVADKLQRYDTTRKITELDFRCAEIKYDIELSQQLVGRFTDPLRREIVLTKLLAKKDTLKVLENQLTKCINLAKYWQIKGFIRDEIARPRNPKHTR